MACIGSVVACGAVRRETAHAALGVPSGMATASGSDIPFSLPRVTPASRARAESLLRRLRRRYPDARCALHYTTPHELLVATILSAQTTDVGVNKATPALFARFPAPADYARATAEEIEPYVRTLGFYRNKALAVREAMRAVAERHGGQVPRTMAELLALRGVARKTANVVLGNAFGINVGVVVDTHVARLSERMGLAPKGSSVAAIEKRLMALFPRESWTDVSHLLIAHGRAVCKARGGSCATDEICREFCRNARTAGAGKRANARRRRAKAGAA